MPNAKTATTASIATTRMASIIAPSGPFFGFTGVSATGVGCDSEDATGCSDEAGVAGAAGLAGVGFAGAGDGAAAGSVLESGVVGDSDVEGVVVVVALSSVAWSCGFGLVGFIISPFCYKIAEYDCTSISILNQCSTEEGNVV